MFIILLHRLAAIFIEYKPFKYKTVIVDHNIESWADFALEHDITYKLLKIFNPWLRSNSLKVKRDEFYEIKIPVKPFNLTADYCNEATGGDYINFDNDSIVYDESANLK